MNLKPITFLTAAVEGQEEQVWVGVPELLSSMSVGIQRKDGSVWSGYSSYELEERDWPNFVTAWYVAQIYTKALVNCSGLTAGNSLLSKCSSVFKITKVPYENQDTAFVINFLTNKEQDIEEVLLMKPPIYYIDYVVYKAKEVGIYFESKLLEKFLKENYQDVPDSLWENLTQYEAWRRRLASQYWKVKLCFQKPQFGFSDMLRFFYYYSI